MKGYHHIPPKYEFRLGKDNIWQRRLLYDNRFGPWETATVVTTVTSQKDGRKTKEKAHTHTEWE